MMFENEEGMSSLGSYEIIQNKQLCSVIDKVRLARHKNTTKLYACKRIVKWQLMPSQWDNFNRGIEIHNRLCTFANTTCVVRIYDILEDRECKYIFMERMDGDLISLLELKPRISEDEARGIFHQAMVIVKFIHDNGVAHRDLKLENFLFSWKSDDKNFKHIRLALTDFELADYLSEGKKFNTPCGSPSYAAPEVCSMTPSYDGTQADIWSCGIMLFALLTGRFPWESPDMLELFAAIIHEPLQVPSYLSPEVSDLLGKILVKNPFDRCTVEQIFDHPWLSSCSKEETIVSVCSTPLNDIS